MTQVVALARFALPAKAHAKVPLSNTTVSGLRLNFRKFKSVQTWLVCSAHFCTNTGRFSLRTCLGDVFDVRLAGKCLGTADELVQESRVPGAIDEARARSLQLMARAANAPYVHIERLIIELDCFADGAAEIETSQT
jgi:hypothetical protein